MHYYLNTYIFSNAYRLHEVIFFFFFFFCIQLEFHVSLPGGDGKDRSFKVSQLLEWLYERVELCDGCSCRICCCTEQ